MCYCSIGSSQIGEEEEGSGRHPWVGGKSKGERELAPNSSSDALMAGKGTCNLAIS